MPSHLFKQVDAFASEAFQGNPAAVMLLGAYPPDAVLQAIAAENNLAETAFLVPRGDGEWRLRWFTPATEVPLCGHATLAAAHALREWREWTGQGAARFATEQSGELSVTSSEASGGAFEMSLPAQSGCPVPVTDAMAKALGARPLEAWQGGFLALRFGDGVGIRALEPDLARVAVLGEPANGWDRGNVGCFARTAPADENGAACVSRFFAPGSGIPEDPATGSWHAMLSTLLPEAGETGGAACFQAFPGRGASIGVASRDGRAVLTGRCLTVVDGVFTF